MAFIVGLLGFINACSNTFSYMFRFLCKVWKILFEYGFQLRLLLREPYDVVHGELLSPESR